MFIVDALYAVKNKSASSIQEKMLFPFLTEYGLFVLKQYAQRSQQYTTFITCASRCIFSFQLANRLSFF